MSSIPAPFEPDAARVEPPVPVVAAARATTPLPDAADRGTTHAPYAAPAVTVLGSLSDLTLGGVDGGADDGWGGAGATGSI